MVLRKLVRNSPKEILPPEPKEVQEIVEQEPTSPSTLHTPSVLEDYTDITTSPDSKSHEEKGPSSRVKLNHPPEVIVGNMNELTLRKCTINKCVANRRVSTSSAQSEYSAIRLMRRAM